MTTVRIIRISERGAKLVTNESVVCWMQGRWVREDNSLTNKGEEVLAAATQSLSDFMYEEEHKEEIRQQRREKARAESQKEVRVSVSSEQMGGGTEKAWKIWNRNYQRLYGRMVKSYSFLPKSLVKMVENGDKEVIFAMPTWVYNQNSFFLRRLEEA